jgi:hypothetical protein
MISNLTTHPQLNNIKPKTNKFFLFGCWLEKQKCNNKYCFENTIDNIEKNIDDYDFGIIAGDNVYPNKDGVHEISTIELGFTKLLKLNKPVYIILGNHDVYQCNTIEEEFKYNKNKLFNMPSNYYDLFYGNNHFIFIDTNLLNNDDDFCYSKLKNFDLSKEKEKMFTWLEKVISYKAENIFIIGHDPIITCKSKKGIPKVLQIDDFDRFINIFSKYQNITYLCADTHNYQKIILNIPDKNFKMNVIIAGTGGAHADFIDKNNVEKCLQDDRYNIKISEFDNAFGYVDINLNNFEIKYIKNINYKKKYIKYKSKYLGKKIDF